MKISSVNLCLLILFLFSINFFNNESRILIILFVLVMWLVHEWKLPITATGMLLGTYSVIFYGFAAVYNPSMMTFYIIPFLVGPFVGYSIGIVLMRILALDREKALKVVIYVIIAGRFLHGLLNFMVSDGYSGYLRNGVDFWTHSTLAATGQGALMTMSISLLFYGVVILKKNTMLEKIVVLVAVALSVLNSLMSASRTAIIIMIAVFLTCFIVYIFLSKENGPDKVKMIIGLLILAFFLIVLYRFDVFRIRTYWEKSPLFERITTESDFLEGDENRLKMIMNAFNSAWNNPFGDGDMTTTAHNLWLDALKQTGWIPFILLVIFTVIVVRQVIKVLRCDSVSKETKYLVFSVVLGALINFAVEPIMRGMPYYFAAFCIIAGAIEEFISRMDYNVPADYMERR